jgi:hypothetical protein
MPRWINSLLVVGALMGTVGGAVGCTGRVRIYDEPYRDYHRWDGREDRAYRVYLGEQRRGYREFRTLDRRDQEEYWRWRHAHPDRDRDDRDRDRR